MIIAEATDDHYRNLDHRKLQFSDGGTLMVEAVTFVAISLATLLIVGFCIRLGYVPLLPVDRSRLISCVN